MAAESAMVEVVSASTLSFLASITSMRPLQVSTFSKCGRPTSSERRAAMIRSATMPNFNGGRSQIRSERLGWGSGCGTTSTYETAETISSRLFWFGTVCSMARLLQTRTLGCPNDTPLCAEGLVVPSPESRQEGRCPLGAGLRRRRGRGGHGSIPRIGRCEPLETCEIVPS